MNKKFDIVWNKTTGAAVLIVDGEETSFEATGGGYCKASTVFSEYINSVFAKETIKQLKSYKGASDHISYGIGMSGIQDIFFELGFELNKVNEIEIANEIIDYYELNKIDIENSIFDNETYRKLQDFIESEGLGYYQSLLLDYEEITSNKSQEIISEYLTQDSLSLRFIDLMKIVEIKKDILNVDMEDFRKLIDKQIEECDSEYKMFMNLKEIYKYHSSYCFEPYISWRAA